MKRGKDSVLLKYAGHGAVGGVILGAMILVVAAILLALAYDAPMRQWAVIYVFWGICAIGAGFVVWGIYGMTHRHKDKLFKRAAELGDVDAIDEYLFSAEQNGQHVCRDRYICMTLRYVVGSAEDGAFIALTENLMWAYKSTVTVNGSPSYHMILAFLDEKKPRKVVFPKDTLQECLRGIESKLPHVIVGYSETLLRSYTKERDEFTAQWRKHKESQTELISTEQ